MMIILKLFLLLLTSTVVADFPAPLDVVDLDLPPRERWVPAYKNALKRHGSWEYTGAPVFEFLNNFGTPEEWQQRNKTFVDIGMKVIGEEAVLESAGLADFVNTPDINANITIGALVFLQMFYELAMECTGVLAQTSHGTLHGRNMDIGLEVHNITSQVTWIKNGTKLFTSTQFLGYNGVHTGMRLRSKAGEGWSVQANERVTLVPGPYVGYKAASALMTVTSFALGATPVGQYLRQALTEHSTFNTAIPYLETEHLASPMYIILGGADNGQGMVLTRDRKGISRSNQFGGIIQQQFQGDKGPSWHFSEINNTTAPQFQYQSRCQTNWDPWVVETDAECLINMSNYPKWKTKLCDTMLRFGYNDSTCTDLCRLYSDGRKEGGTADLKWRLAAGKEANVDMIHSIMSNKTSRVLNGDTKITSVMNSRTEYYSTIVRQWNSEEEAAVKKQRRKDRDDLIQAGQIMVNVMLNWKDVTLLGKASLATT